MAVERDPARRRPGGGKYVRDMTPEEKKARRDAARARAEAEGREAVPEGQPYVREPFKPGNQVGFRHGAGTIRRPDTLSKKGLELAERISENLLGGGQCPEYLLWPQFRKQVEWWAKTEAQEELLYQWLEQMPVEERAMPLKAGSTTGESPLSLWLAAGRAAERARDKLGLTPASHAKIRKDLGLAERAERDAIEGLASQGAQIRQKREGDLKVIPGGALGSDGETG